MDAAERGGATPRILERLRLHAIKRRRVIGAPDEAPGHRDLHPECLVVGAEKAGFCCGFARVVGNAGGIEADRQARRREDRAAVGIDGDAETAKSIIAVVGGVGRHMDAAHPAQPRRCVGAAEGAFQDLAVLGRRDALFPRFQPHEIVARAVREIARRGRRWQTAVERDLQPVALTEKFVSGLGSETPAAEIKRTGGDIEIVCFGSFFFAGRPGEMDIADREAGIR